MPFFKWGNLRLYWVPFRAWRVWSQSCWSADAQWRIYHAQVGRFMVSFGRTL